MLEIGDTVRVINPETLFRGLSGLTGEYRIKDIHDAEGIQSLGGKRLIMIGTPLGDRIFREDQLAKV